MELGEKTDLEQTEKTKLSDILRKMLIKNPKDRLNFDEAFDEIKLIGSDKNIREAIIENYIYKMKDIIEKDPCILSLNENINLIEKLLKFKFRKFNIIFF